MLKDTKVVEEYIKNHFSFVYSIALICPIYLIGGALKDIENDLEQKKPKAFVWQQGSQSEGSIQMGGLQ